MTLKTRLITPFAPPAVMHDESPLQQLQCSVVSTGITDKLHSWNSLLVLSSIPTLLLKDI